MFTVSPALCISSETISLGSKAELSRSNPKQTVKIPFPKVGNRGRSLRTPTPIYSKRIDPREVYRPWEIHRLVFEKISALKTLRTRETRGYRELSKKRPGAVARDNYDWHRGEPGSVSLAFHGASDD